MVATADELLGPGKALSIEPGRALVATAGVTLYTVESVKDVDLPDGRVRFVAVDGGMSDNMRPMLYDAPYEADLVDRVGAAGHAVHGGRQALRVRRRADPRDARCPSRAPGDVLATPVTGAYVYAMANNYNGVPRPPVVFCTDGDARLVVRRETFEDLYGETYRVGLLGHGTVGAAFERLLGERADAIEHITGRRPEVSGVLTRSRGDFERDPRRLGPVVELIGGIEPARDYVLRAMRAGKHVVSANKLLLASARRGAVGDRARAQRPAALRGRRGRRRAGHPRAAGVARRRARRAHPRDRQRHDELHPHRDGARRDLLRRRARSARRSSATPRPTRPTTSPAATPRPRWRSSPGSRSRPRSTSTR